MSLTLSEREVFLKEYANNLNENQLRAVQTVNGPVLLLAVPGSGKTTVLVTRLGYMLYVEGIDPENILTVTYTVAATKDMERRFMNMFGDGYAGRLEFRTINGICAKVIAEYGRRIGRAPFDLISDEKDSGPIFTDILIRYLKDYPTESDVREARTLITYCKNMCLDDDGIKALEMDAAMPVLDIYKEYNAYLRSNKLMDFDDQMTYACRMLESSPELLAAYRDKYRYICVDEAQDTSKIQHAIINLLSGSDGNLFMVGDEDQSIYGFRAAYPEALLQFDRVHPGARVLVMDENYRSNANIVSAADAFIQRNESRHAKHMVATRAADSAINYVELAGRSHQYSYLLKMARECKTETAVLYRDNDSAIPLIDRLDRNRIPFRIKSIDMTFFTHRVVTDMVNILKFALTPRSKELFMGIYYKCQTYLKKKEAERLCEVSEAEDIPVLDAVSHVGTINGMVAGKCRGLRTNLRAMLMETPSKALFRIENPMGYGEYMERNGLDSNKLYILKQIAYNETTIEGFLNRLTYLQDMLKNSRPDYNCPFILSTIHSSKGLEYDRVFLMDVCDGVFPDKSILDNRTANEQGRGKFEEERRLFYVGMTRAKNELAIFSIKDKDSISIRELRGYGNAASTDADVNDERIKAYVKKRPKKKAESSGTASSGTNSYVYWASKYPDHVVIKREGKFWTCRGESAETLSYLLGFNLGGKPENPMTGAPKLETITEGLKENSVSFIVVDRGEIIEKEDY